MNWYAGITKTNLVSMEYYLDEGVVVKPSKYANIDIRNKEFDPGLHYASLQLQINTTRIGSFDFECVVRGFDKQDNHKFLNNYYILDNDSFSATSKRHENILDGFSD
nr:hypothetical protein BaRGS_028583 [Batillaria attramentaria]